MNPVKLSSSGHEHIKDSFQFPRKLTITLTTLFVRWHSCFCLHHVNRGRWAPTSVFSPHLIRHFAEIKWSIVDHKNSIKSAQECLSLCPLTPPQISPPLDRGQPLPISNPPYLCMAHHFKHCSCLYWHWHWQTYIDCSAINVLLRDILDVLKIH